MPIPKTDAQVIVLSALQELVAGNRAADVRATLATRFSFLTPASIDSAMRLARQYLRQGEDYTRLGETGMGRGVRLELGNREGTRQAIVRLSWTNEAGEARALDVHLAVDRRNTVASLYDRLRTIAQSVAAGREFWYGARGESPPAREDIHIRILGII